MAFSSFSLVGSWSPGILLAASKAGSVGSGTRLAGVLLGRMVAGHSVASLASVHQTPVALSSGDSQKGLPTLPKGQTPLQHGNPDVDQAGLIA